MPHGVCTEGCSRAAWVLWACAPDPFLCGVYTYVPPRVITFIPTSSALWITGAKLLM